MTVRSADRFILSAIAGLALIGGVVVWQDRSPARPMMADPPKTPSEPEGAIPATERSGSAEEDHAPSSTGAALRIAPGSYFPNALPENRQPSAGGGTSGSIFSGQSKWTYRQHRDAMRDTTWRFAEVTSENTAHFDSPYAGGSTASIILRRGPEGLNAMLQISRGQFTCSQFANDHVSIRFDDGAVQRFACSRPSSGDSSVIFIQGAARLERQLRSARRVIVEAEFYRHGRHQFTFETASLDF